MPGAKGSRRRQHRKKEEGCGEEGPLRAIFYAEFDTVQGPRIRCQAPKDQQPTVISKETLDHISAYVIPKPEFHHRVMTVNLNGFKVMGYPVCIENKKYPRNELMFNVCFVCHPWSRSVRSFYLCGNCNQ